MHAEIEKIPGKEDVDGHVVVRHIFHAAPWNMSRFAVFDHLEWKKFHKRRTPSRRFAFLMLCNTLRDPIADFTKFFMLLGLMTFGILHGMGYPVRDFPVLPGLLVTLGLWAVIIFVLYHLLFYLIYLGLSLTVDAPTMMDARQHRRREIARDLNKLYSAASLQRAIDMLSDTEPHRSTLLRVGEIAMALIAGGYAIYQARLGETGVWLPILSGGVACLLALHAERSRTLAARMKVARDVVKLALDHDDRLVGDDTLIFG